MSAITENSRAANPSVVFPESLNVLRPVIVEDLVRVGNPHDGGYVVAGRVIPSADCLLSFGINDDWTFEEDFHRRNPGCLIHGYDHTVSERLFRRRARRAFKNRLLFKRDASAKLQQARQIHQSYQNFFAGNRVHFAEKITSRIENSNDATMEKVFSRVPQATHVVVKMDIEGSEYRVIPALLEFQKKVDLIVIEFHDTEPLRETFLHRVRQLLEFYQIIHVHGNNASFAAADGLPDIFEVTFLSRRFKTDGVARRELPVKGVDAPNFPDRKEFSFQFSSGGNS